jgi:hypothetical protein
VKFAALLGAVVCVFVGVEYASPGGTLYHLGWYNVVIAALAIWIAMTVRTAVKELPPGAPRAGAWLFVFGIAAIAFAGIASGLLGPDDRTIVGAPGASVPDAAYGGTLVFPVANGANAHVAIENGGRSRSIGGYTLTSNALLRSVPRTVVEVDARDARGNHLTITQPSGTAFLSPVLLMQSTQTIGGLTLPYDSFALPGMHRIVKAVLFTEQQAASLPNLAAQGGGAVVLFDVEDETGNELPHGIAIARDGKPVSIQGVRLTPTLLSYPAVLAVSVPDVAVVLLGLAAAIGGLLLTRRPAQVTMPQR